MSQYKQTSEEAEFDLYMPSLSLDPSDRLWQCYDYLINLADEDEIDSDLESKDEEAPAATEAESTGEAMDAAEAAPEQISIDRSREKSQID
jgi:hypothetical protein